LYSGYKRNDGGWSQGAEIFVFSWDGQPLKRYLLEQAIRTFVIDEAQQTIYAYSLESGELIKGNL
jgi:hypothetical protein